MHTDSNIRSRFGYRKPSRRYSVVVCGIIVAALCFLPTFRRTNIYELTPASQVADSSGLLRYSLPIALQGVAIGARSVLLYDGNREISCRTEDEFAASHLRPRWFSIPAWGRSTSEILVACHEDQLPPADSRRLLLVVTRQIGLLPGTSFGGRLVAAALFSSLAALALCLGSIMATGSAKLFARVVLAGLLAVVSYWLSCRQITVSFDRHHVITQSEEKGFVVRLPPNVTHSHLLDKVSVQTGNLPLRYVPQHFWESDDSADQYTWSMFPGSPGSIRFKTDELLTQNGLTITFPLVPIPHRDSLFCFIFVVVCVVAISSRGPKDQRPAITPPSPKIPVAPLFCIAVLRLWLVSGDDIVALPTMADSYIRHSSLAFKAMPVHPPGISVLNALLNAVGVPWRPFIEITLFAACVFAARRIFAWTGSKVLSIICFSYLMLHPHSLDLVRFYWSESVCLVIHTLLFPIVGDIFSQRGGPTRAKSFLRLSGILVTWNSVRPELPLIAGLYTCLVICFLTVRCAASKSFRGQWQLLLLPVAAIALQHQSMRLMHWSAFGVYASDQMHSPSLNKLMKSLYRIREDQRLLHAPVTRHALSEASRVSPVMARLKSNLLRLDHPEVINGAEKAGKAGESGPHLFWMLSTEFSKHGLPQSEQSMRAAATELDAAIADGRLLGRRAHYPVNPYTDLWLPRVYPEFKALLLEPLLQRPYDIPRLEGDLNDGLGLRFDAVLGRRALSANRSGFAVRIAAQSHFAPGTLLALSEVNSDDILAASVVKGDTTVEFHFRCPLNTLPTHIALHAEKLKSGQAKFIGPLDMKLISRPISRSELQFYSSGHHQTLPASIEVLTVHDPRKNSLGQLFFNARWGCFALTAFCAALCGAVDRNLQFDAVALAVTGLLASCYWVGRALFYSLIYCWLGWGPDRYMTTSGPLTLFAAIGGCFLLGKFLRDSIFLGRRFHG